MITAKRHLEEALVTKLGTSSMNIVQTFATAPRWSGISAQNLKS